MSRRKKPAVAFVRLLAAVGLLALTCAIASPAAPTSRRAPAKAVARTATRPADVTSAAWWARQAAIEVEKLPDPADGAGAAAALADLQARAGDRAGFAESVRRFRAWADAADDPRREAYGHAALAKAYGRAGDEAALRESLQAHEREAARLKEGHGATGYLIRELCAARRFTEALALAAKGRTPGERRTQLCDVAGAQAAAGRKEDARRTFALAEAAAREALAQKKEDQPYDELSWVCDDLLAAGDLAGAARLAEELPPEKRVDLRVALAGAYLTRDKDRPAFARQADLALKDLSALKPDDLTFRREAADLAALYTFAGDKAAAARTLALVKPEPGKELVEDADFHFRVALMHAGLGDVAACRRSIELARTAEVKAAGGRFPDLGQAVVELRSVFQNWYAKIAAAHIQAGHPEEVQEMLKGLEDESADAAQIRVVLAMSHAAAGRLGQAKSLVEKIEPGLLGRDLVRANVVRALAKHAAAPTTPGGGAEQLKALRDWIATMEDSLTARVNSYFIVAEVLLDEGR